MYEEAFVWCTKSEKEYRKDCIKGIGKDLFGNNLGDIKYIDQICLGSGDNASCVEGAATYAYFYFGEARPLGFLCLQFSDEGRKICSAVKNQLAKQFLEFKK